MAYRLWVCGEGVGVTIWTRNGLDWTDKYPERVVGADRFGGRL